MAAGRIIIADDHVLFRTGVRKILEEQDYEIAGEADDGVALLQAVKTLTAHLVILDISMPRMRGIEAVKEIKSIDPDIKVLMLSMHKDRDYLSQSIASGADGYLLKSDADTELFTALDRIRQGKTYISPSLAADMPDPPAAGWQGKQPDIEFDPLSNREREVLKLIAEGYRNRNIAEILTISVRTVENHRANIMHKLDISNTPGLVRYAIKKGYIPDSLK